MNSWVSEHVGITITGSDGLDDVVGLALRHNPKRAHLLVSNVLGKHVPAVPSVVYGTGRALGAAVREVLGTTDALVLGYAETATGLGHAVADELDADYLHSTRRAVPGVTPVGGFEEEHSHATSHLLLPASATLLDEPRPLVLVDDELTTGRTAANTIAVLHAQVARPRYVVAAIIDAREGEDHLGKLAADLGVPIEVVALHQARVHIPGNLHLPEIGGVVSPGDTTPPIPTVVEWPAGVKEGGRHGFGPPDRPAALAAAATVADRLGGLGDRVLVLGTEELMHAPLLIALELESRGAAVRFSTTTRSPVHVLDEPGYPIRTVITFETDEGTRFAYNVDPALTDVVLVIDRPVPAGLLAQLPGRVHVVEIEPVTP